VRSGFPWLTIRERPELAHYRPRFAERDPPNASPTLVRTPSGGELEVAAPALAAELGPVTLDRDPAVLRAIARERDARLGVYGSTVELGRVAVGDPADLEP
jgi:hypothetical protein